MDLSRHASLDGSAAVATTSGEIGTAGCLVRVGSRATCILSSAHVLAGGGGGPGDARVFQPPVSQPSSVQVAQVWDVYAADRQSWNVLDAAIAVVNAGVDTNPKIGQLGRPRGFNPNIVEGERVWIHGAGSGIVTSGQILALNDETSVTYADGGAAWFYGLAKCERYSIAGDSGAAVVDENLYVVGVHLCGTDDYSWFCPIQAVLSRWPAITVV